MLEISYISLVIAISCLWLVIRCVFVIKNKSIELLRELQLLLVYICIIVVARFTFFPFSKLNGSIQPLVFDISKVYPFRINYIPFIYLFDYPKLSEALLNLIGNTAMFIPLGVVWPIVYKELNTPIKVITAGIGFSLCIEILQLPFYDRVSDIDDLILNSLGYIIGYLLYLLVKYIAKSISNR